MNNNPLDHVHAADDFADDTADFDEVLSYDANQAPNPAAWLETDEALRIAAVEEYHVENEPHLLADSLLLHAAMHSTVETQLAAGDPPQIRNALARLQASGVSRHEALHALSSVLARHLYALMSHQHDFDRDAYVRELDALTAESWATMSSDDIP